MLSDDLDDDSTISSHEWKVEQACKRHGREIFNFWHFLHDFPMMGLGHPIGRKTIRELKKSPKTILDQSHWFRASIKKEHLLSRQPRELVSEQRYNSGGQPYLYLSNDAKCAVAEVTYNKKIKTAWVQRLKIERLEYVLDLRPWNDEDENVDEKDERYSSFLMALIFCDLLTQCPEHFLTEFYSNKEDEKEIKWKCAYLMTRFVADAARHCGFSGVLYSSVRFRWQNLVVFSCNWNPKPDGDPYELSLTQDDLIMEGNFMFNQGERCFILGGN
jgi:hypothetical protein